MACSYAVLALGVIATAACATSWKHDDLDYYTKPKYHYKYGVDDPKHGDYHSQWEERDGDKVKGGYSLKDADGVWRHVSYTADKENGFNAIVERHGKGMHARTHAHHSEPGARLIEVGHEVMESYPDAAHGYIR